ncbi:helix-turn-helix domain-containing protein [Lactococcus formosensis]|uniref:helix-turn-helix domain-containing protein n=1 Tax=Lactococcus formosensis TaxID=1281486 RepID=UPI001BD19A80|nr:helix-turn-helix transcriptional regulator [Lactococcus formosensis]MDG6155627.1 helix-turn-helix domain-containing protein [Lactococcus formosensis]
MTITADRIKQSRESKKWTKGKLAKEMGVSSQTTISNWENGSVTPNETKLKELSRILDVDYLYLLGFQTKPKYTKEDKEKFLNEHVAIGGFSTTKKTLKSDERLGKIVGNYFFSNEKGKDLLLSVADAIASQPEEYGFTNSDNE